MGLPSAFVEPLQVVSYIQGQHFDLHHDAGTLDDENKSVELVHPRRLVTLFVYLNTLPLNEGHTEFPYLNISVRPERGAAILFCNLLPSGEADFRTSHLARSITRPDMRKLGLNIWIGDTSFQSLAGGEENAQRSRKRRKETTKNEDVIR